ncbi:MAG: alpha/beta hydrolase family protein [Ktedonobacterales bacterium]
MSSEHLTLYPVREVERLAIGPDGAPALLVRPNAPGEHPGAVLQHGYASEKAALLPFARQLAALGFVVLLADAWGHGERFPASGPNWLTDMHADYAMEVIQHTVDDVHAGLTTLAAQPDVRPDALLVGGFSLGAIVALIAGTEDSRVAGVASLAGSSLPDLLGIKRFNDREPSAVTAAYGLAHDAAARIARLAPRPLLLSHGTRDDLVPVAGTLRLYELARPAYAAQPDHLTLQLYEHGHDVGEQQVRDAVSFIARLFLAPAGAESDDEQPLARASGD